MVKTRAPLIGIKMGFEWYCIRGRILIEHALYSRKYGSFVGERDLANLDFLGFEASSSSFLLAIIPHKFHVQVQTVL